MRDEAKVPDPVEVARINAMCREEMASLWRFAPIGHPWFDNTKPYFEIFNKRFSELGRMSPEISKRIERSLPHAAE